MSLGEPAAGAYTPCCKSQSIITYNALRLEAAIGIEPMNKGFADHVDPIH